MSKKGKISLFVFLLLVGLVVLLHVQARRVILALVQTQADEGVEAKIGTLQLLPFKQSILLKNVSVSIHSRDSTGFRKTSVKRVYLEIGSQWNFIFGGTLNIEKMVCEGGELIMARKPVNERDSAEHVAFDLSTIFDRVRNGAIRFNIEDISFKDFNLVLLNDSVHAPTVIKHFEFRARDLYLSADSILKRNTYIEFGLPAQQIDFPNGPTTIKFDTLFFSTTDNSIQINELEVSTRDNESGSDYRVSSDKVRVAYFDFESLYTRGVAIVDTVFLGRSKLEAKVNVHKKEIPQNNKELGYQSLPYMLVRNLVVSQLAAHVKLQQDDVANSFVINNSFVTIQQLKHNPDSSQRLHAKSFDILISEYETFLNNKNTSITFDTIRLHSHGVALLNFNLSKANQQKPILQAPVFELKEVDWYTLLFFKRLVAEEAVALNPIVNTTFLPLKGDGAVSQQLVVLESLKEVLDVNVFSLRNASANLYFAAVGTNVTLKGIDASVRPNEMIQSRSFDEVLAATEVFAFRNFTLKHDAISARVADFDFRHGRFYLGHIAFKDGKKIDLKLDGLKFERVSYDQGQKAVAIAGLAWESAVIRMADYALEQKASAEEKPTIDLFMVRGGDTDVNYSSGDIAIAAHFNKLNAESLRLGKDVVLNGIDMEGDNVHLQKDTDRLSVKTFSFEDGGSLLAGLLWRRFGADSVTVSIRQIAFVTDFNMLAKQRVVIPQLNMHDINAHYSKHDSTHRFLGAAMTSLLVKNINYIEKKLTIGSFNQTFDSIYFLEEKKVVKDVEPISDAPVNERWKIRDKVDSLMYSTNQGGIPLQQRISGSTSVVGTSAESGFITETNTVESGRNGVVLSVSNIETFSQDSSTHVKASLDSMRLSGIRVHRNNIDARIEQGLLENLKVNSVWVKQPMEMLRANHSSTAVHDFQASIETADHVLKFDRLDYDPSRAEGTIKGFEHRPRKNKKAFLDESFFQTNFMDTRIESLSFHHWDARRFTDDSTIHIRLIRVVEPSLEIDRDKTHPFYSSKIRLLPTNAFQKLGMRFRIDSLQFNDGRIVYTEKSKVTSKEGSIHFTKVAGLVRNIKNIELEGHDTLFIRATARFLDSANVNLKVRESYQDSLAGFLMTTQVSPFHSSILNPMLVPLVSVKFESGYIDTLHMRALGREHLSLGRMKFLYHDLKVSFLDQNDTSRHSIRNYILKVAANTLVIRTNNKKRIGDVFEVRDRHRAVFQYWVKMILSGVTTSVGAKSNRSQMKKYLKELDTKKLPAIEESLSGF